jgi:ABC-type nitrate/sulfonate/bicarbonate transport system substrate-binding protein
VARLSPLTVNVFPGGFNWPIFVGQMKGFFAQNGIEVTVQNTPDSVTQMTDFAAGRFDIAMTAVDNIVAYVEGQGQAPIGPQPELFGFMGVDTGFLSLVAAPDVKGIADLRGRSLCVDAMTTGYAFVLYEILRQNGLERDRDYRLESAGGMIQRWTALREGRYAATLLSAPYHFIAGQAGFTDLGRAVDLIGPYQGNVAAARRSWAKKNPALTAGYARAFRAAVDWLYESANKDEAIAILLKSVPNMTPEVATASYRELLHPVYGFARSGAIDTKGMEMVLALRNRFRPGPQPLTDITRYCDTAASLLAR